MAEFDWELLRRASALNGPTDIAPAFVDYLNSKNEDARRFEQLDAATINFIEELQRVAAAPVSLICTALIPASQAKVRLIRLHWQVSVLVL